MQRQQAFKFELMPDGQQQRCMRRFAGACRFVFNQALALTRTSLPSAPTSPASRGRLTGRAFAIPTPKQFKLDEANARIFLPKLGWLRYRTEVTVQEATHARHRRTPGS